MIKGIEPRLAVGFNWEFTQTPGEHAAAIAAIGTTLSLITKAPQLKSPLHTSFLFQILEVLQGEAASIGAIGGSELETTLVESKLDIEASDRSIPLRDITKSAKGFNFSKQEIRQLSDWDIEAEKKQDGSVTKGGKSIVGIDDGGSLLRSDRTKDDKMKTRPDLVNKSSSGRSDNGFE